MKKLIPNKKISGLRFGQLIVNALGNPAKPEDCVEAITYLFYIENEKLEKLLQEFIEKYERGGEEGVNT